MSNTTVGVTLAANMDVSQVLGAINSLKGGFNGLSMPKNLTSDMEKSFEKLTQLTKQFQQQLDKGISTKSDAKALAKTGAEIDKVFSNLKQQISDANAKEIMLKADVSKLNELESKLANLKSKLSESFTLKLQDSGTISLLDRFYAATNRAKTAQSMVGKAQTALLDRRDIGTYTAELDKLQAKIRTFKESTQKGMAAVITGQDVSTFQTGAQAITAIDEAIKKLKADGEGAKSAVKGMETDLAAAAKETSNFRTDALERGKQNMEGLGAAADHTAGQMRNLAQAENESANAMLSMKDQVGQLRSSTQYFFSLRNMINLLKRGINEAVQSVKELDAAMTQTAVVTDFSVADMWGDLPKYTKLANELGATTQGAYETMTLYYQQGLDQQATFEIGAETMKMARIAGLDYAQTTDMMTAALRGFNMELNEASAKRINDVYSELAARTASDTQELGEAMERTASIANSAGMSFEGTTAFLAQMIETTREAPENLGTAMKTIVARFQELKKNPLEIVDVEGEEVSFNKVDTALQSIGVSLKDTNGQFRNLDDVFLDISSRWDGLTQTQQRYIATIAAGSRQQSRFIAMMNNYDRTVELMGYANDSAGASQEQFNKTMDSLESKLNKLHNAWQQFTMGIADNGLVKGAVDGLTGFLNITNKIINALSLGVGPVKSFLSIFAAFTGLKIAGRVANSLIGGLGGLLDPQSSFKQGLLGGATGTRAANSAAQAHMISDPIVAAINNLAAAMGAKINAPVNTAAQQSIANYKDFKNAQTTFRGLFNQQGGFTLGEAFSSLEKVSKKQQGLILSNAPGMSSRINRGLTNYVEQLGLDKQGTEVGLKVKDAVMTAMKQGTISVKDAEKIMHPTQWGKIVGPEMAKSVIQNYASNIKTELQSQDKNFALAAQEQLKAIREQGEYSHVDDETLYKQLYNQNRKQYFEKNKPQITKQLSETALWSEKVTQTFSGLGASVTSTGQAFSSFGIILSNLGLSGIGTAFMTLGSTISSLGMTVTSLSTVLPKAIAKIKEAKGPLKALKAGLSDAGLSGFAGGLGAVSLIAAVAMGVAVAVKKSEEKAKESAKKIQDTYTKTAEEITNKMSTLQDNRDRFETLSEGIDEYGNNIGLTNAEYEEYLTLSKNIADIAPELIAGYDAEGNAIIAQGDAIDQLIAKQKELQQQNAQDYTTNSAFEATTKGIRVSDAFKEVRSTGYSADSKGLLAFDKQVSELINNIGKAGLSIQKVQSDIQAVTGEEINLYSPDMQDIQAIGEHYNDLIGIIEAKNPELSETAKQGLKDAFTNFGSSYADLQSELRPLTDQIKQYLSLQDLDAAAMGLSGDFVTSFNSGLENISLQAAINNWDGNEIKRAATEYANSFNQVAGEGSEYQKILEDVEKAQQDYLDTIDQPDAFDNYQNALESSAAAIRRYASEANDGTEAGEALYQMLMRSAAEIESSATEPIMSIGEALNTLSDDIDEARGAYDRFSEATKNNDFSTAAEGMSKILEEGLDDKHTAGLGDNTFWTAARETLPSEILKQDKDEVVKAMKNLQPALQAGEDGYNAFYDRIQGLSQDTRKELHDLGVEFEDGTEGMITKIPENAFSKVAEALGASDQSLVSMLNNAQQFAHIDFSNYEALKQSVQTDTRAVASKTDGSYYMNESVLTAEIRSANPNWDDSRVAEELETLENKGIKTLPSKETLQSEGFDTKEFQKNLQDIGATTQKDLLNILGQTGTYDKETLQSYLEAANLYNPETFNADYKEMSDSLKDPMSETNSTLHAIEGYVAALVNQQVQDNLRSGNALSKDFEAVEGLRKEVYGKEGVMDGVYQMFSLGKNEQGQNLSKQEYTEARKQITDALVAARATSAALLEGKSKASYGTEQYEEYQRQYKANQNLISNLEEFLQSGNKKYKEQGGDSGYRDNADYQTLVAQGWNEIFKSIDPQTLNTPEAQQAYSTLMSNALLSSEEMQGQTDEVKANVQQAFEALGIDIQAAADAGLINWKPEDIVSAVDNKTNALTDGMNQITQDAVSKVTDSDQHLEALALDAMPGFEKIKNNIESEISNFINSVGDINVPPINNSNVTSAADSSANTIASGAQSMVQQITQQVNFETSGQEEAQSAIEQVKQETDTDATLQVKAAADSSIQNTLQAIQGLKNTASSKTSINTGANVSGTADVQQLGSALKVLPQNKTIPVRAHVSGQSDVNSLKTSLNSLPSTKTVTVNIRTSGSVPHVYTGANNKIAYHHVPQAGSAARGTKKGRVGPRNQGGPTLTGELGYEIAWLPDEGRSMILGSNGPQMVNLPRNAVIWNHEQSEEIMKRKSIPTGSMSSGNSVNIQWTKPNKSSSNTTKSSSNSTAKTVQKTSKAVKKSAEDAGKAVGKVSVWWENIARKTEVSQRNMDKSQKAFENYIKEMRSTLKATGQSLKSGGGGGDDYIKNIGKYIGYYQAQLNKANKELKTLNTGKGGTQKQMKANYGGDGHENIAQISYKKGKKSKEEYVNLASYIKAENGTYVVDQKALNKEKNVEKRKAIADAANKEINDRLSKKYKAEDEIEKANEALKKMGEELYETFFKWENELTKIWNITQKIEQAQSRMSRNDAYGDLLKAQLSTGKLKGGQGSAQKDLANFRNKLKSQNQLLQNRQQAITESKKALQHLLTSDEEKATLAEVNSKLNKDNQATAKANKKAELDKAKQAKKNYDAAVKNRATAQSKLNSVNSKIAKLEKKRKKSKKEKQELKNLKAQRTTYQNQIANYNKTISANKSLAGQVNKLQKEYNGMASGTALSATQRAGYEQYKKELQNQIAAEDLGRKYTTITKRADGTIDVQFNTEAFEKARLNGDITNDMAKAVQDWVKKIQEASANLQENYENLIKDVTEYYTQLESLQDEWANYGKELTEITEDAEKQKIDKVKQLYDGVKKALDKLLDEVKRKLDERRKQEENAKTERDISQKQQRLAMLRADTSGGHQVEIAQLEQEIAEAQQNYQNSLEDQLVDKLQQQADLAAEQRERQIEIQEALATSVNNIEKVNEWMANPALYEDEIREAYYAKNNYDNVTNAEQAQIETDFNEFYNGLLTNQTKQEELIKQIDSIQSIVAEIEKALTLQNQTLETAKADGYTAKQAQSQFNASLSDLRTVGKYTFDDFVKSGYTNAQIKQAGFGAAEFKSRGISYANAKAGGYSLDELEKGGYTEATKEKAKIAADKAAADKAAAAKAAAAKAAAAKADKQAKYNTYINKLKDTKKIKPANVKSSHVNTLFDLGAKAGYGKATVLLHLVGGTGGSDPFSWKNIFKAIIDANGIDRYNLVKTWPNGDGTLADAIKTLKSNPNTYAEIKKHKNYKNASALKFATGGLADYTGLAWLDGTSSKPELVLNARDTKNFIMLKDVLSKAMDSSGGLSGFGGAAYEININVDHINSDYDVDKIAKRVKENIVKDSGYRNVTQVRKFR